MIDKMFEHNRKFVESGAYKEFEASKYPSKKIAVVTCMDTRLVTLLPAALGIKNGDVKMIKNAGGLVVDPYGDSMRSLLVAVYELGVEKIMIIAHTGCGVQGMKAEEMMQLMEKRGIDKTEFEKIKRCGIDLEKWLSGFEETEDAVRESVKLVGNHPLLPKEIEVSGYVMDTLTGELKQVTI